MSGNTCPCCATTCRDFRSPSLGAFIGLFWGAVVRRRCGLAVRLGLQPRRPKAIPELTRPGCGDGPVVSPAPGVPSRGHCDEMKLSRRSSGQARGGRVAELRQGRATLHGGRSGDFLSRSSAGQHTSNPASRAATQAHPANHESGGKQATDSRVGRQAAQRFQYATATFHVFICTCTVSSTLCP